MRHVGLLCTLLFLAGCSGGPKFASEIADNERVVPVLSTVGPDVNPDPERERGANSLIVPAGYTIVGACSYVDQLSCWDLSGKLAPELEAEVRKVSEENEGQLNLEMGRKHRLLVAKRAPPTTKFDLLVLKGAQTNGTLGWASEKVEVMIIGATSSPETQRLTGSTSSWQPVAKSSIRLKPGQTAGLGPLKLTFRGLTSEPATSPRSMRRFELAFDVRGDLQNVRIRATPIGLNGVPIDTIDDHGNPTLMATPTKPGRGIRYLYVQPKAVFQLDASSKRGTVRIYVQPIKLSRLDLELSTAQQTQGVEVPLDPK